VTQAAVEAGEICHTLIVIWDTFADPISLGSCILFVSFGLFKDFLFIIKLYSYAISDLMRRTSSGRLGYYFIDINVI
jgi:hypothetical protein